MHTKFATISLPPELKMRRLLRSRRPEHAAMLQAWLNNPPLDAPEYVISLLAHIAKDARNAAGLLHFSLYRAGRGGIIVFLQFSVLFWLMRQLGVPIPVGSAVLLGLLGALIAGVETLFRARAINRAALLLASTGDTRAIPLLANIWTPCPFTRQEARFNADVSRELTRLLSVQKGRHYVPETEEALHRIMARAFSTGRAAQMWSRLRPRRDLTEADADLLLSIVRHLSPTRANTVSYAQPHADEITLRRVTSQTATGPHYDLLRDTAHVLLRAGNGRETP